MKDLSRSPVVAMRAWRSMAEAYHDRPALAANLQHRAGGTIRTATPQAIRRSARDGFTGHL